MIKKIERYTRQNVLKAVAFGLVVLLFSPVCPANAQTEPDITTGLVGHWKLDETSGTTAVDSSGNSYNGTMNNGLDASSDSVVGRLMTALNFDGAGDNISVPDDAFDNMTDLTACAWVYRTSSSGSWALVASKTSDGYDGWNLYVHRSSGRFGFYNTDGRYEVSAVSPAGNIVKENEWTHICGSTDGGTSGDSIQLYYNGQLESANEVCYSGCPDNNDDSRLLRIGTDDVAGSRFAGYIDDVRVYDRILDAEDIVYLYQSFDGNIKYDEDVRAPKYFNGDDWVAMGPSKYTPNAVAFNGTNDYLSYGSPLAGVSDGKTITASFWAKFNSYPSSGCFTVYNTNPSRVRIVYCGNGTETMQLELRDTGGALRANVGCGPDPHVVDTWYHHLISINMTTGEAHCYVDDADSLQTFSAPTDVTLDFTNAQHTVGAGAGPSELLEGDIADLWIDYETYIDFSIEANRRKFIDADGNPIYLGASGSAPTGSAPDIFLSGDTDTWHTNKGTGGGFTENGALTDAITKPRMPTAGGCDTTPTVYATSGTYTYTAPSGCDTLLVEAYGAGGAGGNGLGEGGGGGGGGSVVERLDTTLLAVGGGGGGGGVDDPSGGGGGGYGSASVSISDEEQLNVWVGGGGSATTSGSNGSVGGGVGGGAGGDPGGGDSTYGGGGGSADDATGVGGGDSVYGGGGGAGKDNGVGTGGASTYGGGGGGADGSGNGGVSTFGRNGLNGDGAGGGGGGGFGDTTALGSNGQTDGTSGGAAANGGPGAGGGGASNGSAGQVVITPQAGGAGTVYCADPIRPQGTIIYNENSQVMQYCDGEEWQAMGPVPGDGTGGCSNPARDEGSLVYNRDYSVMQYCEGDEWVSVGEFYIPEDKYVFLTDGFHNGNLGGLSGADAICQADADDAGHPGTYYAWLSDSTDSPSSRFTRADGNYIRIDNVVVANGWDDLTDGTLDNPITLSANGTDWTPVTAHSSTTVSGTLKDTNHCNDWTYDNGDALDTYDGRIADVSETGATWTDYTSPVSCHFSRVLYCFQQ
jgi:hypothetical protein